MKIFYNSDSAFDWINQVVDKSTIESKEEIAREAYKDSKQYTYIDTEKMYDSGENSDFKNGYVLIKAPQVRWLYYTTGIHPHKNMEAVPQWFEKTKRDNIDNYVKIYNKLINENKK